MSAATSASVGSLYATLFAQMVVLTVGGPAERDSENQQRQRPVQICTRRSAKGATPVKHLDTASLCPADINTLTVAHGGKLYENSSLELSDLFSTSTSNFHTPRANLAIGGGAASGTHHADERKGNKNRIKKGEGRCPQTDSGLPMILATALVVSERTAEGSTLSKLTFVEMLRHGIFRYPSLPTNLVPPSPFP
ncbi:hypothetical protein GW17_00059823 [Ensete ventricosum]|nr:hypothetical protein GW17_00059823 [Ensete ventricosum]